MSNYGPGCFNSCVKMCLGFFSCFFFFSVEDVIEGVYPCYRWGGNEEDL